MIDARFPAGVADGIPVVTTPAEIDITSAEQLRSALLTAATRGGPARAGRAWHGGGREGRSGAGTPPRSASEVLNFPNGAAFPR